MKPLRKRILLVEDDCGTRLLLERMLLKIDPDINVVATPSAENAYYVLNEIEWDGKPGFDLVVADIHLPGSNGFLFWDVVMKRFPLDFLFISSISRASWADQIKQWMAKTGTLKQIPHFLQKPLTEEKLKRFLYAPQELNSI
jgi:response regulator of citrate/malate metabolism